MKNLFCERLSELKKEKGLTTIQLANAISYSKTVVYYWEKGQREPTSQALLALSNFFNCSIDFLLGRSDDFGNVVINSGKNLGELSPNEEELLTAFKHLNLFEQDSILVQVKALAEKSKVKK